MGKHYLTVPPATGFYKNLISGTPDVKNKIENIEMRDIKEKIARIERKIDLIFGGHILINGKWEQLPKELKISK